MSGSTENINFQKLRLYVIIQLLQNAINQCDITEKYHIQSQK